MYHCMNFAYDWDEDKGVEWGAVNPDPKIAPSPEAARHRTKFDHVKDGFNRRWKECVRFGEWITADKSRVAGWYHSALTIGPEPKPIRTGATIHSVCVTKGPLASYKVRNGKV